MSPVCFVTQVLSTLSRLSLFALIPFVFPIVLALFFLFAYRYRPSELGANARYWYLPFFINLLVGGLREQSRHEPWTYAFEQRFGEGRSAAEEPCGAKSRKDAGPRQARSQSLDLRQNSPPSRLPGNHTSRF